MPRGADTCVCGLDNRVEVLGLTGNRGPASRRVLVSTRQTRVSAPRGSFRCIGHSRQTLKRSLRRAVLDPTTQSVLIIVKSLLKTTITSGEGQKQLPSLGEVHSTVWTSHSSIWRRLLAFSGPAYLVSGGYMDPGNWGTDLLGGSQCGDPCLWLLVMSNAMAVLLQTLSARLGIVRGLDLAQACREVYPRPITLCLWVLCEVA